MSYKMQKVVPITLISILAFGASQITFAQDLHIEPEDFKATKKEYSPYVNDYFPNRVYFGDTHLHTSWSTDAGMLGATLGPDAAYRVARGEVVTSFSGFKVKLVRPLDFIVVADHAENLGLSDFIRRSDPIILANETGKCWHDLTKSGNGYEAFIEWASMPEGNNMHRVVIFRDDAGRTEQILPYTMYDSVDAEDLWGFMAGCEEKTGGQVLAIPHNGNLSNGMMFDVETYTGKRLTKAYAEMRMRFEPLIEVTQIKGDGETHPYLSPDDAFADFETLDVGNITGKEAKTDDMLAKEYARSALQEGLRQQEKLGANPYKFGMIGSTDAHNALPTTREDNNFGKANIAEPSADRYKHYLIKGQKPELSILVKDLGAAGLAAVWARANTRESIWDSMARKEVYATTGSRLRVRVFAGWDFASDEVHRPDFARTGYARGVPMGGDLTNAPAGAAPVFMIRALRDPDGANMDRVQIIKGWIDGRGKTHERVYDVSVSDGRSIGKNGIASQPVGNTVDIKNASYTNTIGDALKSAYWVDPDFDSKQAAFYYVRVIEIPTPRWTAYDAKYFNFEMPEGTSMIVQDRAYTSPIWYTP